MKNPATGTTVAGQMVTPTGLESGVFPVVSGPHAAVEVTGQRSTWPTDASHWPDKDALPSAVPSFLEACARLASEAAMRGDFIRARNLIERAARVTELAER
jgi:hypothetical protein